MESDRHSVPADEYDGYAPHIVSMISQGCSLDQLCAHLESVRVCTDLLFVFSRREEIRRN